MDSKENAGGDAPRLSGGIVTSVYGQGGRLERWILPDGFSVAATPEAPWPIGVPVEATQQITAYTYDPTGRELLVAYPGGTTVTPPSAQDKPDRAKSERAARKPRKPREGD